MSTSSWGKAFLARLSIVGAIVATALTVLLAHAALSAEEDRPLTGAFHRTSILAPTGFSTPGAVLGAPASLVVTQKTEVLGARAREPMIIEHPNGALFVSGFGQEDPKLWKSADHGATWSRVTVGTTADGALGNSDVDLAVARDGTLYFVSMTFDRASRAGLRIAIGVSRDAGGTWSWTTLSETRGDDRPWVDVAPDGRAHVIWNDGNGVNHAVSRDRGATWVREQRVHDHGGSSHMAIGPRGEVAVRVTPASKSGFQFDKDVDLIAVSEDAGKTWRKHAAPGARPWTSGFDDRWVEPLAWDGRGALYSFWTVEKELWLARSNDRGATWTQWQVGHSADTSFYPYLIAHGDGEVAATWFSRSGDTLQWHAETIRVSRGDARPRVTESPALPTDSEWAPSDHDARPTSAGSGTVT